MKITDMKVHMMQVPLVRPFRISLGVITHAVSCLVEIETDAGITGLEVGAYPICASGTKPSDHRRKPAGDGRDPAGVP